MIASIIMELCIIRTITTITVMWLAYLLPLWSRLEGAASIPGVLAENDKVNSKGKRNSSHSSRGSDSGNNSSV